MKEFLTKWLAGKCRRAVVAGIHDPELIRSLLDSGLKSVTVFEHDRQRAIALRGEHARDSRVRVANVGLRAPSDFEFVTIDGWLRGERPGLLVTDADANILAGARDTLGGVQWILTQGRALPVQWVSDFNAEEAPGGWRGYVRNGIALPVASSLWIGSELPMTAELTIQSYLTHGHEFHLYAYGPVKKVPLGTTLKDASEIMPYDRAFGGGRPAVFSDAWRMKFLHERGGFWTDLDAPVLGPVILDSRLPTVVQGNNGFFPGFMSFPTPGHPVPGALSAYYHDPATAFPWDPEIKAKEKWDWRMRSTVDERRSGIGWAAYEAILPAILAEHSLEMLPRNAVLACSWREWMRLCDGGIRLDDLDGAVAVHLFAEMWRATCDGTPTIAQGSVVADLIARYLVRPNAPSMSMRIPGDGEATVVPSELNGVPVPRNPWLPSAGDPEPIALIYTYPPDYPMARIAAEHLILAGARPVLAIDVADPPPPEMDGVQIIKTTMDRKGNLNGRDFVVAHLELMASLADGCDYLLKVDSDTIVRNLDWLVGRNEGVVGFMNKDSGVRGCCYAVKPGFIGELLREVRVMNPRRKFQEDLFLGRAAARAGSLYRYTIRWLGEFEDYRFRNDNVPGVPAAVVYPGFEAKGVRWFDQFAVVSVLVRHGKYRNSVLKTMRELSQAPSPSSDLTQTQPSDESISTEASLCLFAHPRAKSSLLSRLLAKTPGMRIKPVDPLIGKSGKDSAFSAWEAALREHPGNIVVLLQRNDEATQISFGLTKKKWIPGYDSCKSDAFTRMRAYREHQREFAKDHDRVVLLNAKAMDDFKELNRILSGVGISVEREHWERERLIVTEPGRPKAVVVPMVDPVPKAIVLPWREGAAVWDELRYALRSIHQNLNEQDIPIYILGTKRPKFLAPEPGRIRFIKVLHYEDCLRQGLTLAHETLWTNDDILFLNPVSWDDLKTAIHSGDWKERTIKSYTTSENSWQRGVAKSVRLLEAKGYGRLNFSTHTPYLFERERVIATMREFELYHKIPFETLYFNQHASTVSHRRATPLDKAAVIPSKARFLNYTDGRLTDDFKEMIRHSFPDQAPWELVKDDNCAKIA